MITRTLSATAFGFAIALAGAAPAHSADVKNVVIVHGAFADGSGWRKVTKLLTDKGYNVSVVQQPITSLADDVTATRRVLGLQNGPVVLVGHSYGGMVISEAGNEEHVKALVYVAAFQPDNGESLVQLNGSKPVEGADPAAIKATPDDFLYLDPKAFPAAFAADLPEAEANFLARSQVFAAKEAFTAQAVAPAWKNKPSWAVIAKQDRSINPDLEREMARRAGSKVREVDASHAVYISQPEAVAASIVDAAQAASR